ncbi:hypothetical protein BKH41_01715 [Helicobacter sp. 12S02232-10]|uniref:Plug domain-containing protein n=1 Tax=Helicobacter sp. 12S02232-10 TaxID=1476197 RepID=UPI000BD62FDA|nr:Plug domain-containing protein [Helicobacter sp. 12S02232-10]PAF49410.1 hypothetical protein BKH41_01715 [Helicobacter sp. 12S02232-10]
MKWGGGHNISEYFINAFPSSNGQITDFLKINPNVQFSNSFNNSKTPGEIDPPNVSINGAPFYQNLFQLDGISINNDLNPAASNPANATIIPGRSQGLAVDASMIQNIRVYDSNISAKYGGFEGGVIDAQTKNPSKEFKTKLSYQFTSSKLTKYHIYDSEYENFIQSDSESNQPEFFKYFIRGQAQGYVTKDFGIIGSFSTTQSIIPLYVYQSSFHKPDRKKNKRAIYNYFLKGVYSGIENLFLEASLAYMPQNNQYFILNTKDSLYSIHQGGWQALLKTSYDFKFANFIGTLSYSDETNSRNGEKQYFKAWKPSSEKNWGTKTLSSEGTWGNVDTIQRNITYKSNMDFEVLEFFHTKHLLSTGIQLGYTYAYYGRPNDFYETKLSSQKPLKSSQTCSETDYCSASPVSTQTGIWKDNIGQYAGQLTIYQKGKIQLDNFAYGLYIEDNINLWRFHFRPGVRLDGDTYMKKLTLAPRISLEMDVFGNGITHLMGGYNRYYGRNIMAYRLQDGIKALELTQTRSNPDQEWTKSIASKSNVKFEKLKIPYNDEFVAGISQKIWQIKGSFKYVRRNGKDEIIKVAHSKMLNPLPDTNYAPVYFTYSNEGKSVSDIFSLSIEMSKPIKFFNIYQDFLFTADYSNIHRNFTDYANSLKNDRIFFEGKTILLSQLPPDNFAKPWNARFTSITNIKFSRLLLTWSNFFSFRSGYIGITNIGKKIMNDGTTLTEYKRFNFPNAFNWDTRIGLNFNFWGKNTLFMNLDIYNLLDNLNIATAKFKTLKGDTTTTPTYEAGRSFWLQAGYEF